MHPTRYHALMHRMLFYILCICLCAGPGAWARQPATEATIQESPFLVSFQEKDRAAAEQSLRILREAAAEFGERLPPGNEPIRLRIAASMTEFQSQASRFGGLGVSGLARPHEGFIVVRPPRLQRIQNDYRGTLRHELVHILLYRNANTSRLPKWLNEGICMRLANEHHWESMFRVGRMFGTNRVIAYKDLDHMFLAPGSETTFGDAYAQALSMTRHLYNKLGEDTFWDVVLGTREMSFGDAMRRYAGWTVLEFADSYRSALWWIALLAAMASGSFFTPIALLSLVTFYRKHRSNRKILRRMEAEEAAEARGDAPQLFVWESVVDDPDAWKHGNNEPEEEDESWRG